MSHPQPDESRRHQDTPRAAQPARTWPPPFDRATIVAEFLASSEYAHLEPDERELQWVDELLDTMELADWGWVDLDLDVFETILLDGLGWTIESAPEDPGRVARVLDAFLSFAGRAYGAPHTPACCVYLRSPAAVADIARWVRPFDELAPDPLFAELSAPYNWCDGRCDRCPLAVRCPVRNFDCDGLLGIGAAPRIDDPEEKRAFALAAAHAVAAREALEVDPRRKPERTESPTAARLRSACRDFGFAVIALRDALADLGLDKQVGELRADAMLVAVKGGRVAGYLSDLGALEDEAALMDGVPNLLLIERLVADIDRRLEDRDAAPRACRSAYRQARDELLALLRPLLRALPARYRDEIRSRVMAGCAPSPFATPS